MQVATIRRTPATPMLNGTDLVWLIESFVLDCRAKTDNQKTVDTYECRLRWFVEWWEMRGPAQKWLLQAADLVGFERYLRASVSPATGRPLAWTYRSGIIYTLREVFHWAHDKGYTEHNHAAWVPAAHGAAPKRKAAGTVALTRLLQEAGKSRQRTRDRAMIAVFVGMGLRRGEVSNLDVQEIVFQADMSGHAHVFGKRTRANPVGDREAAFDAATGAILAEHIRSKHYTHGPVFRNKVGDRLTPNGVYQTVKQIIHRAKLWHEIKACHDLRRGFTTYYARTKPGPNSADLRRRQLGHARFSQTTEYQLFDVEDIRQDLVSPVGLVEEMGHGST